MVYKDFFFKKNCYSIYLTDFKERRILNLFAKLAQPEVQHFLAWAWWHWAESADSVQFLSSGQTKLPGHKT